MTEPTSGRGRRTAVRIALVGAGVAAGAIVASAVAANAASTTSGSPATDTAATSSTSSSSTSAPSRPNAHGAAPVRSDEKSVSASVAAKLKAAALKAVPGGSVYRVETDAGDAAYEAHMTKADGTEVTVKFDKNLAVVKVEPGMGQGDPRPAGGPHH